MFAELPPRLGERHCVGSVSQNHLESRSPGKKGNGEERLRKGSFKSWRSHFPNPTKKVRGGAGMFGRSEGLTLPSSPISYSPNIRKIPPGFPLEDLWIWGFGVSPQTFPCLSLLRLCASLVVLKRISSLPRLIPYARGRRGDDPIPVSRSQMREIRDFDCCRGNRRHCLSLLNAAFFPSRLPRMHDYHANVSPGSQVSAGHIERKRSLSLLARLRANKEVRRARVRDVGTSG